MKRVVFGMKLVAVVMAGLVVGCASTTINGVMADPGRYRDKEVTVAGEVEESLGILGRGFFKLRDGQDALWVYTSRGLPRNGSRLNTRGRVHCPCRSHGPVVHHFWAEILISVRGSGAPFRAIVPK